jgi:hypothetical protein
LIALAGTGAERHADHRHGVQQVLRRPGGVLGDLGAADLHQQLDAAAGRVDQAHQRHAQLVGQALDVDPLVGDRAFGAAGLDGEVVDVQRHLAPVDAASADDRVGRVGVLVAALGVVVALAGQRAHLVEAAGVDERGDALARVHAAAGLEPGQRLGAAHRARAFAPGLQLGELGGPLALGRQHLAPACAHFCGPRFSCAASSVVAFHSACR